MLGVLIKEQKGTGQPFKAFLDAPVMHVDGTVARVNGNNNHAVVCSNGAATMYFARENKGHAGVKGTPVETFGGILIHDHEACFYGYGSDHQKCMVHIGRYLKDSIENEKYLTWNRQMLTLIQEMIHENNMALAEGIADEKVAEFGIRYDTIVQTAAKEYKENPLSDYYKDGYNLCERKARILKGKINQAISLRSFEHLANFCECLSVLDHFATDNKEKLFRFVQEVFKRKTNQAEIQKIGISRYSTGYTVNQIRGSLEPLVVMPNFPTP